MTPKKISTEEFDRIFDEGKEDIMEYLDLDNAVVSRPDREVRKVNVDMPLWMVEALDKEAKRVGIGRQAVIKMWLAERLDEEARRTA
ncbi:type II toxin-antitoxin system BrnA family antitoxin [Eggerthella guodeyinii]|uniref:CopG family transcriptional regulator n=1 Tax=Eggerthella guodeyinii TaxID=2690837 RepID=A0A6N7RQS6_9ACTN|nr:CopG family transcriptional regulator [Eggerthella guodeyinii]MRX83619.1 CopG family transcriptional regulator [Eggerthella guodeyinii]